MKKEDSLYNGILYGVVACLVILTLIMLTSNLGDEEYLELSFSDVSALPKVIDWDESESFSFTLGNKYQSTQTVSYKVLLELDGDQRTLSSGEITLNSMETQELEVEFSIEDLFETGKIIVQAQDLEIYFNIVLSP